MCVCVLSPHYFLRQGLPLKLKPAIRLDWLGSVHQSPSPQPCSPKGDFADCSSTKETISPTGFTVVEVGGAGAWVGLSEIIPCLLEGNELLLYESKGQPRMLWHSLGDMIYTSVIKGMLMYSLSSSEATSSNVMNLEMASSRGNSGPEDSRRMDF